MTNTSPGTRFALAVSAVTLLFALLGAGLAWRVYDGDRQHAIDETERTAITAALNADRFLADRVFILSAVAAAPPVRANDIPGIVSYVQTIDSAAIGFGGGVGWVDRNGLLYAYTGVDPALLPFDISEGEHVQTVLQGQAPYVGEAFVDSQTGLPVLPIAAPTFDANGEFTGLVVGTIRLNLIEAAARERRFGTDDLYIVDRGGNIVIGPETVTELVDIEGNPLLALAADGSTGVVEGVSGVAGDADQVIGFASVPAQGWTILVERSEDELFGDARRTFLLEIGGLGAVWLFVTGGAHFVGRRINRVAARATMALEELEVREARLRNLTEATTQVAWTVEPTGRLREPEQRWSSLTGLPMERLDRTTWLPYVHTEDRESGNETWRAGIASGRMIEFEQRVNRPDGDERRYLVRAVPVRETDGRIREWIGVDIDVTQQRRAEATLRETADRLSLALEVGQLGTWDLDIRSTGFDWLQPGAGSDAAWPADVERYLERVHPEDRDRVREAIRRAVAERSPYEIEHRTAGENGAERWLSVRGEAFHDAAGRPERLIGVDVDVTERKTRELFQQDFIANVAHDVKNPLAAVKAQAQLLRRRVQSGRADEAAVDSVLGLIDDGLTRMNRRIEELADVARLRAGRQLQLRMGEVNLGAMIRTLIASYEQTTDRHTITFDAPEPDLTAHADELRIERVIDNLISNAVKYSPDGGAIRIELARDAAARDRARLSVTDHGIGIPSSDVAHIFERYRRAGNTAVITGTGIGLAGARQIVEQHGGRIEVASREGAGSTFTVILPLIENARSDDNRLRADGADGRSVPAGAKSAAAKPRSEE